MLHKINYYVKRHIHIKNPTSTEYFSFNHDSNIFYAFGLNSGESAFRKCKKFDLETSVAYIIAQRVLSP